MLIYSGNNNNNDKNKQPEDPWGSNLQSLKSLKEPIELDIDDDDDEDLKRAIALSKTTAVLFLYFFFSIYSVVLHVDKRFIFYLFLFSQFPLHVLLLFYFFINKIKESERETKRRKPNPSDVPEEPLSSESELASIMVRLPTGKKVFIFFSFLSKLFNFILNLRYIPFFSFKRPQYSLLF